MGYLSIALLIGLLLGASPETGLGQSDDVPAQIQVAIINKLINDYLPMVDTPKVCIIYAKHDVNYKDQLLQEFKRFDIDATAYNASNASEAEGNIYYLTRGISIADAKTFTDLKKVILTNSTEFVELSYAGFGIIVEKNSPQLIINSDFVKRNGIQVDIGLFRIAKVIEK